jgi:hypothetical protein
VNPHYTVILPFFTIYFNFIFPSLFDNAELDIKLSTQTQRMSAQYYSTCYWAVIGDYGAVVELWLVKKFGKSLLPWHFLKRLIWNGIELSFISGLSVNWNENETNEKCCVLTGLMNR